MEDCIWGLTVFAPQMNSLRHLIADKTHELFAQLRFDEGRVK